MVFTLWLMFGLPCFQISEASHCSTNATLICGKVTKSQGYCPALFDATLPSEKTTIELGAAEGQPKNVCSAETRFSVPADTEEWIAFVRREGCAGKDKIKVATWKRVSKIIIWDDQYPSRDRHVSPFKDASDFDALKTRSQKRKQVPCLIQKGIRVVAGTMHFFWKISLVALCLTLTCLLYLSLHFSQGLAPSRQGNRRPRSSKTKLQKAVQSLEVRRLKRGEADLAKEICVMCLDAYKPREMVRVLTCRHVFHKRCIDRWLLKRGLCPVCKQAIFQKE